MVGDWAADGFEMHWLPARWGMMFGFMQAQEDGVTVYWETFRYTNIPTGGVTFEPTQMGVEQGVWPLVAIETDGRARTAIFESETNILRRTLSFRVALDGSTLEPSVDGQDDGAPHRQHWLLRRIPAPR